MTITEAGSTSNASPLSCNSRHFIITFFWRADSTTTQHSILCLSSLGLWNGGVSAYIFNFKTPPTFTLQHYMELISNHPTTLTHMQYVILYYLRPWILPNIIGHSTPHKVAKQVQQLCKASVFPQGAYML